MTPPNRQHGDAPEALPSRPSRRTYKGAETGTPPAAENGRPRDLRASHHGWDCFAPVLKAPAGALNGLLRRCPQLPHGASPPGGSTPNPNPFT